MTHVVTRPASPFQSRTGALTVHQIPAATDNLVWLVVTRDGEAAAVDGPDAGAVLEYCERNGFRLTAILNTHTHGDHVGINRDLEKRGLLADLRVVGPRRAARDVPGLKEPVDDGDTFHFGGVEGQVLLTEGHLNGHVSFVMDGLLFCGDTLFGAGCGYLFDGPPEKMHASLTRLSKLPGDTLVCCAHEYTQDNLRFAYSVEPDNQDLRERLRSAWQVRGRGESTLPSTIELERRTNPFLRHGSAPLVERVRRAMPDRRLESPEEIFAATRALKDQKHYRSIPDTELPVA